MALQQHTLALHVPQYIAQSSPSETNADKDFLWHITCLKLCIITSTNYNHIFISLIHSVQINKPDSKR